MISIASCLSSWLDLFLSEGKNGSRIFKARLHNPVQDIERIVEGVNGTRICYQNGLVYCYGTSFVSFYSVEKKLNPKFSLYTIKSKKVIREKLKLVNLPTNGILST